jgi:outer membrane protein, multidrug efflux system
VLESFVRCPESCREVGTRAVGARALILAGALSALAGCVSLAPSYERPAAELPQAWSDAPADGAAAPGERWWTLFDDAVLNALVDEALAHNRDLEIAAARVEEARGLYRTAQGLRWPALGASASRDRTRFSQRSATPMPGTEDPLDTRRATLDASYELDFFSRLRDASRAARAELLATRAAEATVRISLTAQVVQSYYSLSALDAQVAATRRSLALRVQDLELQKVRYGAGLIGDFDLRRREAEVASARAQLPALERARAAEELALAVLLGRSPREIVDGKVELGTDRGEPPAPMVPDGLPSELLLRRPDLVRAEQQLIAANALIGSARAAFFPRITLSGYYGSESAALSDLFTGPAGTWQFAAGLTQPIFQGGRLFGELGAAHGLRAQALAALPEGDPGGVPRRAPGADHPGALARDLRRRGRAPARAGRDAAPGAHPLRQRPVQPARAARRRAQPAGRRAQPHRRPARPARGGRRPGEGAGRRLEGDGHAHGAGSGFAWLKEKSRKE